MPSGAPGSRRDPAACRWPPTAASLNSSRLPWPCTLARSQISSGDRSPLPVPRPVRRPRAAPPPSVAPPPSHRACSWGNSRTRHRTSGCPAGSRAHRPAAPSRAATANPSFHAPGRSATASVARDQCLLQPEAQDDVRRIGHLVGIDADEAALHSPPQPRQVAGSIRRRIAAECSVQLRPQPPQERIRAARLHLDDQRLAFVRRHAGRLAHRLARPRSGRPRSYSACPVSCTTASTAWVKSPSS